MDKIIVLDFGGQYCHLISRRIMDAGVFSKVLDARTNIVEIKSIDGLKGIILSGGAQSVFDPKSPKCDKEIFNLGVPVLGICYGHQLIAQIFDGMVKVGKTGEYGLTPVKNIKEGELLKKIGKKLNVWMNHRDIVVKLPSGFKATSSTSESPIASFENKVKNIYGVQFHPEVTHTNNGDLILKNFAVNICKAKKGWDISNQVSGIIKEAKETLQNKNCIIGLSGGVDSSVAAYLMSTAIGKNLTAVYVDTGLMRHKETDFVRKTFSKLPINLKIVDAGKEFFAGLKGITEPEQKRKTIGALFIKIFDREAKKSKAQFLIQGTIYSDRIESGLTAHSSNIKSHHNVGGLPKNMKLKVYEPLRDLYKDEVRSIGRKIGISEEIITRHVFPGPGLAVRILGEVTKERALIARASAQIVEEELKKVNLYKKVWMAFTVVLPIKSVGIQGDARSYKCPVVVRIIESKDAMTANFSKIPYDVLEKISTRITNEITDVNRVVYDISNKPPATMEWE